MRRALIYSGVAVALFSAAGVAVWRYGDTVSDAARSAVIGEELRQELREAEAELKRERERRREIAEVAERRLEELDALRDRQAELQRVIEDDDDAADWADRRLPGAVRRLVRDGAGDGHADGDGDAAGRVDAVPDSGAGDDGE